VGCSIASAALLFDMWNMTIISEACDFYHLQEPQRARIILAKARGEGEARVPASSTQRVFMKSAIVERELGNGPEERRLLKVRHADQPSLEP